MRFILKNIWIIIINGWKFWNLIWLIEFLKLYFIYGFEGIVWVWKILRKRYRLMLVVILFFYDKIFLIL